MSFLERALNLTKLLVGCNFLAAVERRWKMNANWAGEERGLDTSPLELVFTSQGVNGQVSCVPTARVCI